MKSNMLITVGLETETRKRASKTNLLMCTMEISMILSMNSNKARYALLNHYLILPLMVESRDGSDLSLFFWFLLAPSLFWNSNADWCCLILGKLLICKWLCVRTGGMAPDLDSRAWCSSRSSSSRSFSSSSSIIF